MTMRKQRKTDFLVIGAGIMGLATAKTLKEKFPGKSVLILEKEPDVAAHASGRNSGVLHAGFYYSGDSLKARFTISGNRKMKEYCRMKGLKINECKKVVVAKNERELDILYELERRGKINGVPLRIIDESELMEIEPNARTLQKALYSPETATVDPLEICKSIKSDLLDSGVKFIFSQAYFKKISDNSILTAKGTIIDYEKVINCAGLYADKIAEDYNLCDDFTIIPFKGVYLKYSGEDKPIKTNIYPVPDIKNPFLGVHYTVTADNHIKIGPTAIPAFWRENYDFKNNFKIKEFAAIISWESLLFLRNSFGFRDLAFREIMKYNKSHFTSLAEKLVRKIDIKKFNSWVKPGIRAQLLNKKKLKLVEDFVVRSDKNSVHILNAVSPAFTSSFAFTKWVIENYIMEKCQN